MVWVFVMFMNGWMIDVDEFPTRMSCEDKVKTYNSAFNQSRTKALVWCEQRPRA